MATLRSALPDNYLSRLAFLEDVLFDQIKIEDGVVPSVVKKPLLEPVTLIV